MTATTESTRLMKDRAYAATRVLERRRISLEAAVEVLEIVGYKVYQDREGHYNVEPPHDHISKYEVVPEIKPTPEAKEKFCMPDDLAEVCREFFRFGTGQDELYDAITCDPAWAAVQARLQDDASGEREVPQGWHTSTPWTSQSPNRLDVSPKMMIYLGETGTNWEKDV